ncbi:MAG: DUF4922 domain-containing protein [Pseudomonadota bacterium]
MTGPEAAWAGRFVDRESAASFGHGALGPRLARFLDWQADRWPRLAAARAGLAEVQVRAVQAGGRRVLVQFNPARAVSTTAAVDATSVAARPCFLCPAHLPAEERGLPFQTQWVLLANPAPILPGHLVLAHRDHRPQAAVDALPALVDLAAATADRCAVIYNGPAAGASAPDHLHLQALDAGLLPEERVAWTTPEPPFLERPHLRAWAALEEGRTLIGFRGQPVRLKRALAAAVEALATVLGTPEEPRLNLLCTARGGDVLALLFPRAAHRPACYFAPEPERLAVSPGALDMAGALVSVRAADFARLDAPTVAAIYREVSLAPATLRPVLDLLQRRLSHA